MHLPARMGPVGRAGEVLSQSTSRRAMSGSAFRWLRCFSRGQWGASSLTLLLRPARLRPHRGLSNTVLAVRVLLWRQGARRVHAYYLVSRIEIHQLERILVVRGPSHERKISLSPRSHPHCVLWRGLQRGKLPCWVLSDLWFPRRCARLRPYSIQ